MKRFTLIITQALAVALVVIFSVKTYSQNPKIDSLWKEYKGAQHDTVKIKLLNEEIGYHYESINSDSAIKLYQKAILLSDHLISSQANSQGGNLQKLYLYKATSLRYIGLVYSSYIGNNNEAIKNLTEALSIYEKIASSPIKSIAIEGLKGLSRCYNSLGVSNNSIGNYEKALEYYQSALKIFEQLGDSDRISGCYGNIANVYINIGKYDQAIEIFSNALKSFEETKSKKGISTSYKNIGKAYRLKGMLDKALDSYLKSLRIEEEIGSKRDIANCYNSIGIVQNAMGNDEIAIEYYTKSLIIAEELGDKNLIANCYGNIANIESDRGNHQTAIDYYHKSLQIEMENGNQSGIALKLNNIAADYHIQGDCTSEIKDKTIFYRNAIDYYQKALSAYKSINDRQGEAMVLGNIAMLNLRLSELLVTTEPTRSNQYLKNALIYGEKALSLAQEIKALPEESITSSTLRFVHKNLGNYRKALYYAEYYISTRDSMFREEKTKAITEMQTKYETEKKQQEIEKQQLVIDKQEIDNRRQRNQRNFFIAGTFLLALLALVVFRGYQQKKRSNTIISEKNAELERANEEIAAQRDLVTEQKEHIESIHEELTSSIRYARRIQGAVLPAKAQMTELLGDHFVLFKPKDIVSGDFFWATRVKHFLIFCVADCTGHGVPGAFMSMLGVSFLNDIVHKQNVTSAAEVLNHLRNSVIAALKQTGEGGEQKDGMDMGLCVINTETKQMQFAGGYNPCWVIPNMNFPNPRILDTNEEEECGVIQLKPDKMPIAIHKHMEPYTNHEVQLYPGDQIYLMSDGFQDQFGGPQGKKFMVKNLRELVVASANLPMGKQCEVLEKTLEEWKSGAEQVDDVTIMGIKM